MLNIGPAEVLVIALIALIVVGPEQLPGVLRKIGKGAGQLRNMADGLKKDFMSGMDELDPNNWAGEKPRGKGTMTDPIIGPGAYGGAPTNDEDSPDEDSPAEEITEEKSNSEGKSTRQLAEEKAAKDEAAARAAQPITQPDEMADAATEDQQDQHEAVELVESDEGDQH